MRLAVKGGYDGTWEGFFFGLRELAGNNMLIFGCGFMALHSVYYVNFYELP